MLKKSFAIISLCTMLQSLPVKAESDESQKNLGIALFTVGAIAMRNLAQSHQKEQIKRAQELEYQRARDHLKRQQTREQQQQQQTKQNLFKQVHEQIILIDSTTQQRAAERINQEAIATAQAQEAHKQQASSFLQEIQAQRQNKSAISLQKNYRGYTVRKKASTPTIALNSQCIELNENNQDSHSNESSGIFVSSAEVFETAIDERLEKIRKQGSSHKKSLGVAATYQDVMALASENQKEEEASKALSSHEELQKLLSEQQFIQNCSEVIIEKTRQDVNRINGITEEQKDEIKNIAQPIFQRIQESTIVNKDGIKRKFYNVLEEGGYANLSPQIQEALQQALESINIPQTNIDTITRLYLQTHSTKHN